MKNVAEALQMKAYNPVEELIGHRKGKLCVCVCIESSYFARCMCSITFCHFGKVLDKRSSVFLVLVLSIVSVPNKGLLNNILE